MKEQWKKYDQSTEQTAQKIRRNLFAATKAMKVFVLSQLQVGDFAWKIIEFYVSPPAQKMSLETELGSFRLVQNLMTTTM
jgi:hypothetical protein